MLLDSNVIIYAAKPEHEGLRRLIAENAPAVSAVSYVEVLGYHRLTAQEMRYFKEFFAASSRTWHRLGGLGTSGAAAPTQKDDVGRHPRGWHGLGAQSHARHEKHGRLPLDI